MSFESSFVASSLNRESVLSLFNIFYDEKEETYRIIDSILPEILKFIEEKNIFTDVYTSLERMKIQQIPILQLHGPSVKECEDNQVVNSLQKLQSEGLVKWIGISTSLPDLETFFNWDVFDIFQLPYSLLNRKHHTWITKLSGKGHGIIVNNGIAQGEPNIGTGETSVWEKFNQAHLNDLLAANEDPTQFALRYAFTHPYIDTNIVGTTNINHLEKIFKQFY